MLNKEKSQIIRKALKDQLGATSRQISVRTEGSSIRVTINDLNFGLHMDKIKKIANQFEEIHYDEVTNEILLGGNTYVDVELNYDSIENAKKDFIELATKVYNEALNEKSEYTCTTIKRTNDHTIYFHLPTKKITLHYNNEIKSRYFYACDIDGIAEALTYIKYEYGVDILANEEIDTIEEVKEEEVETKVAEQQENNNDNTTNSIAIELEINFNSDKDGIELKFNSKPDEEVRAQLKENGFRWSRYKKIWFAKDTEERRNFVNTLNNQEQQEENIKETNDFKIIIDGEGKREKAEFDNFKDAELELALRSDINYGYNKTWITIIKNNKELNRERIDLNSKTDLTKGLKEILINEIDNDIKYCNLYIKDIEEMQRYIEECNKVKNILINMDDYGNLQTKVTKEIELIEINPINAENFPISKELSKRENEGHWTFRTKERDHQQEILNTLNNYYNAAKEVINSTNNINIINSINIYCNSFNKKYYNNYLKRLTNNANNPSWAVTGRAGRNTRKDAQMNSRYDNLMRELISLEDEFENKLFSFENKIQTNKRKEYFKEVEQCTTKLDFKRSKIKINVNITNDYFNVNDNENTIDAQLYTTEYNNAKYHLIKSWGRYEAINDTGNTIGLLRVKNLEMAKQMLTHYILKQNEKISV